MALKIIPASIELLDDYESYILECFESGMEHYENDIKDAKKSLYLVIDAATGRNLPEGWGPYETYFAVDERRILGAIRLRLSDNDFIRKYIGHIGYEVRPSERRKGVAKALLKFIVHNKLKASALITCDFDNDASVRVINSILHEAVGNNEKPQHRNPKKLKFYVEPST
ncbi:MAG: putative acetyltransferase [Oceanospirillaceae bacterium]|jgi:predicted acetyltransferase